MSLCPFHVSDHSLELATHPTLIFAEPADFSNALVDFLLVVGKAALLTTPTRWLSLQCTSGQSGAVQRGEYALKFARHHCYEGVSLPHANIHDGLGWHAACFQQPLIVTWFCPVPTTDARIDLCDVGAEP